MRIAIVSDIHGNMEAFQAVVVDIGASKIDAIISLGDNIGYGPESEEVAKLIREYNIPSVMGNHELGLVDRIYLENFNPIARTSLLKTGSQLSNASIDYNCTLKPFLVMYGMRFVHGFPPDSVITYQFMVSEEGILKAFQQFDEKISFTGHSHYLELIDFDGKNVTRRTLNREIVDLDRQHRHIINIGSVGQPRDGDKHAKYAIMDTDAYTIEIKFVKYDIMKTVVKILKAGFPKSNARRLM
ncbi:metallophosphoesterase family protein [Desulfococcaceae bacterium HSG9]|nr:metallophosphoesterase family protein [Desulfococcaceae bacterium HSG9]